MEWSQDAQIVWEALCKKYTTTKRTYSVDRLMDNQRFIEKSVSELNSSHQKPNTRIQQYFRASAEESTMKNNVLFSNDDAQQNETYKGFQKSKNSCSRNGKNYAQDSTTYATTSVRECTYNSANIIEDKFSKSTGVELQVQLDVDGNIYHYHPTLSTGLGVNSCVSTASFNLLPESYFEHSQTDDSSVVETNSLLDLTANSNMSFATNLNATTSLVTAENAIQCLIDNTTVINGEHCEHIFNNDFDATSYLKTNEILRVDDDSVLKVIAEQYSKVYSKDSQLLLASQVDLPNTQVICTNKETDHANIFTTQPEHANDDVVLPSEICMGDTTNSAALLESECSHATITADSKQSRLQFFRSALRTDDGKARTSGVSRKLFAVPFKKPSASVSTNKEVVGKQSKAASGVTNHTKRKHEEKIDKYFSRDQTDNEHHDVQDILKDIQGATLIALTLVYSDGTTQLSEPTDSKADALIIGCAHGTEFNAAGIATTKMKFSDMKANGDSFRQLLDRTMANVTAKKVCFDLQQLVYSLLQQNVMDSNDVLSKWHGAVSDPRVASWMLNPDSPPATFKQCLICTDMQTTAGKRTADDLCDLLRLDEVLESKLQQTDLADLYHSLEMPLNVVLAVMETRGLLVSTDYLLSSSNSIKRKLDLLEAKAYELAGSEFALNSPQQLREILYDRLQLDKKLSSCKMTLTFVGNQKSTSEVMLTQLSAVHPLPGIIQEYRKLSKLKSTYFDGLLPYVCDGRLYTRWDQTAAATGRVTSACPNVQALPRDSITIAQLPHPLIKGMMEDAVEISARKAFVSRPGFVLLTADFQQIEFRLVAHFSGDSQLQHIFSKDNTDVFISLASLLFAKRVEELTPADREQVKRAVYAVIYGVGPERLAEYLKTSVDQAKATIALFLGTCPGVKRFIKECTDKAKKHGYLTTLCKRRRWFANIGHTSGQLRCQAERQAVNFLVQGSAADICKSAMVRAERALQGRPDLQARLVLQIHDELLFEVATDKLHETARLIKHTMELAVDATGAMLHLNVPLVVALHSGLSWASLSPITVTSLPT